MARYVHTLVCPSAGATAKIHYSFICDRCGKKSDKNFKITEYAYGRPGNVDFKGNWRFSGLGVPVDIPVNLAFEKQGWLSESKISYSSGQYAIIEAKAKDELWQMIAKDKAADEEGDYTTLQLRGADFHCVHCGATQKFVNRMQKLRIQSNPKTGVLNAIIISILVVVWVILLPAAIMNRSLVIFMIFAIMNLAGFGWMLLRKKNSSVAQKKYTVELQNIKKQPLIFDWDTPTIEIKSAQSAGDLLLDA